jgi:pimeloyl-ACP methyl ester carboxylesterase
MITPAGSDRAPVCIHLAGVGDEGYALRRYFAMPLLRHGIGSVILENPFYGVRRPARQRGIALRRVTDQFVMNMASVEEACALLVWLRERGHAAAGLTGHSMGGYMAALAAVVFPEPVAVMSCATGLSAAPVFTDGLLSRYIDWDLLANGHNVEDAKARLRDLFNLASLSRFEPPKKPSAAVLLAAQTDGYVPPSSVRALHAHWPGSQLRWMPGGHVRAVTRRRLMAQAVADAFGALG